MVSEEFGAVMISTPPDSSEPRDRRNNASDVAGRSNDISLEYGKAVGDNAFFPRRLGGGNLKVCLVPTSQSPPSTHSLI